MNTHDATPRDYQSLNHGSNAEPLSLERTEFHCRITDFWWEGHETSGARGIVPVEPFPTENVYAELKFWLLAGDGRRLFKCSEMGAHAALAHAQLFVRIYSSVNAKKTTEGADQDGRWKEMKLGEPEPVGVIEEAVVEEEPVVVKRTAPNPRRKKKRAQPLDPLAGLLY